MKIPKPPSERMNFHVSVEVAAQLRQLSALTGISITRLLHNALVSYLKEQGNAN